MTLVTGPMASLCSGATCTGYDTGPVSLLTSLTLTPVSEGRSQTPAPAALITRGRGQSAERHRPWVSTTRPPTRYLWADLSRESLRTPSAPPCPALRVNTAPAATWERRCPSLMSPRPRLSPGPRLSSAPCHNSHTCLTYLTCLTCHVTRWRRPMAEILFTTVVPIYPLVMHQRNSVRTRFSILLRVVSSLYLYRK